MGLGHLPVNVIESLNNLGFLIKKANKLYHLMSSDI
jgi:hypothetical protein